MLTIEKGFQRKYQYGGSGLLDTLMSAVTSNAAKEIAKKSATEIGNRATKKLIDKIMPSNRHILDKHLHDSIAERYRRGEVINVEDYIK